MHLFTPFLVSLGLAAPSRVAHIESIHFESLTVRTLVLAPGPRVEAPGVVYLARVNPQDGQTYGRWFRVVTPRAGDPRYDEFSRRRRGRIYVSVPVSPGDWLATELALRTRKGDTVVCALRAPAHAAQPVVQ